MHFSFKLAEQEYSAHWQPSVPGIGIYREPGTSFVAALLPGHEPDALAIGDGYWSNIDTRVSLQELKQLKPFARAAILLHTHECD